MDGKEVRQCLHNGQPIYGTHVTQTSNPVAASLQAMADLDFVFLCTEHMPVDRTETSALSCLYASKGISPIVRVPHPSSVEVTMALDAGAQGIVVPYVETVDEVIEMVGAVHFRPAKGKQLRDFLSGKRKPTPKTTEFFDRFNRNNYLIIGIESVAAYENLGNLISVDGVDGVFLGAHDLSVSLEAPEEWDNPELHSMIEDIVVRCRAANVGVGVHMHPDIFPDERARRLIDMGMNWVADGADVAWAVKSLNRRRLALGLCPSASSPGATENISSCIVSE